MAPLSDSERPEPCPRVTRICDQLYLGGLGGLSSTGIEVLLQSYAVTHLVVCGRPDKDEHVTLAQLAVQQSGATELHVAPLVPEDPGQVLDILENAVQFVRETLEDDLNNVLVACSKGASRSVVVVLSYLLTTGRDCQSAFDFVASQRWRIWPSALLVKSLLQMETRLGRSPREANRSNPFCRCVGSHAAWATAWHNGQQVSHNEAESTWDQCGAGNLEEIFARCKQKLLGKSANELAMYTDQPHPEALPPHAEVTDLGCNLMLCGLGSLSEQQIASLLTAHELKQVILCGRPGQDSHVAALQKALPLAGLSSSDMFLVPVADSAAEDLGAHFKAAIAFTAGSARSTLVACRQGASRSATVAAACLMSMMKLTPAEAFQQIYAKRWRIWPNPGFVLQLLSFGSSLSPDSAEAQALLEMVGIRSAWAANQQNLQETGFGQKDLSIEDVAGFWRQACSESSDVQQRFERCKELTLGVDLDAFEAQDSCKKRRLNGSGHG